MSSRSIIQPLIMERLQGGRMTDKALAFTLRTTLHGIRSACNALHKKGLVKRYKTPSGDAYAYEAAG